MNPVTYPEKLRAGDTVRVIAPSRSLAMPWLTEELKDLAKKRLEALGLRVTFGRYVNEIDQFESSAVNHRLFDLHEAFRDPEVHLILTVIGGYNSNQLLSALDFKLIASNPKILCGYSDITALQNAILAQTGLVTYSGPHFFSWGEKHGFDYTLHYFRRALFTSDSFEIEPAEEWSDDRWAGDQENRHFYPGNGHWGINAGEAKGRIIGCNLCTLQLLHGTPFMPSLDDAILFIEETDIAGPLTAVYFDRDLQSLIHQPGFERVRGLVVGRFRSASEMTREKIVAIIRNKPELQSLPVIANVDFGHSSPIVTLPIGGQASMFVEGALTSIEITEH